MNYSKISTSIFCSRMFIRVRRFVVLQIYELTAIFRTVPGHSCQIATYWLPTKVFRTIHGPRCRVLQLKSLLLTAIILNSPHSRCRVWQLMKRVCCWLWYFWIVFDLKCVLWQLIGSIFHQTIPVKIWPSIESVIRTP